MEDEKVNDVEEAIEVPKTQETEAPIVNEEVETLRGEIGKLKAFEANFKSLQPKYQKLLEDSRYGGDVKQEVASLKSLVKLLAAAQSQGVSPEYVEEMPKAKQQDLIKAWEVEEEKKRQAETRYNQSMKIYGQAEEIYGDDIDALHQIRNFIRNGDFDLAEKKIERDKVKESPKKESEEDMKKRIEEEVKTKIFKERGWNITDDGAPSGASGNLNEKEQAFIEGKLSIDKLPPELLAKYR